MEIFVLLGIPLLILFIAWYQNEYDMTVRKGKSFGDRSNKSFTYQKHKLDKKQAEENDKKYKRWKEVSETKFERETIPDDYYQSEEYKKFCEERTKKYNEKIATGELTGGEQVFYGDKGGRYRIRYNKNGEPYRDYF